MGEHADDIIDRIIDQSLFPRKSRRKRQKSYQAGTKNTQWRDGKGRVHNMADMATSHLIHALNYCEQRNDPKAEFLSAELSRRSLSYENLVPDPDPEPVTTTRPVSNGYPRPERTGQTFTNPQPSPESTSEPKRKPKVGRPVEPITIRGVTYSSHKAAAEILGVAENTVSSAKRRDRLDYVGIGSGRSKRTKKTCTNSAPTQVSEHEELHRKYSKPFQPSLDFSPDTTGPSDPVQPMGLMQRLKAAVLSTMVAVKSTFLGQDSTDTKAASTSRR